MIKTSNYCLKFLVKVVDQTYLKEEKEKELNQNQ